MRAKIEELELKDSERGDYIRAKVNGKWYSVWDPDVRAIMETAEDTGAEVDIELTTKGKWTNITDAKIVKAAAKGAVPHNGGTEKHPPPAPIPAPASALNLDGINTRLDKMGVAFNNLGEGMGKLLKQVEAKPPWDPDKDRRISRLSLVSSVAGLFQGQVKTDAPPEALAQAVSRIIGQVERLEGFVYGLPLGSEGKKESGGKPA